MDNKQRSRGGFAAMIAVAVISLVVAMAALAAAGYLFFRTNSMSSQIHDLSGDTGNLTDNSAAMQKEIDAASGNAGAVQNDIAALKKDIAALQPQQGAAPTFNIASFDLKYTSAETYEQYEGTGAISCDSSAAYIVMLKVTLVSGGAHNDLKDSYQLITVEGGKGSFSTYTWDTPGQISKPDYKFEILGFVPAQAQAGK